MAGKPTRETTDGAQGSRRKYERLGAKKRPGRPFAELSGEATPLQAVLESITDGFLVLDREGRCTYVNRTGAVLFDAAPETLIGKTLWDAIPQAWQPRFQTECARAIEQKAGVEFEQHDERSDRWFLCRCRPVGEGVAVVFAEITERRRVEEALRESEQRLRLVLDGGKMGIWEWDLRTDSMFWCRRVRDLLGVSERTAARGDAFLARVHPQDRDALQMLVKKTVADRTDFQAEFRVIRRDGETREEATWLKLRGKAVCEKQGDASRMLGVLYEVTDRKQMEAELLRLNESLEEEVLAQTEEMKATINRLQDEVARRVLAEGRLRKRSQMLEAFFQHTITPLAFLDRSFSFIRVNEAYARADDKTPEYFVGRNYFMLYPDAEMREIFDQVVQTRQPYRAHARPFMYPDGPQRVRYWNWQLTPVLGDSGGVRFLVFSLEDVTSQRNALHELRQRASQLQKLTLELSQAEDRERRRLSEILHDDLQQVLAAAKFHLGMLNTRIRDDEELRELSGHIGDLLKEAIGKSRSLSHELSPAVLYQSDLAETFEWLACQLQTKHGLNVQVEARGRIEPQSEAIRAFIYKAAQELLFNVVKHAGVAEARLRVQQRMGGHVWLTISDKGRGFDSGTLNVGGYGLMSIRERVELLGGRMRIKSTVGRGSTFLIRVPDQQTAPVAQAEPMAASAEESRTRFCDARGAADRSLRVLLVDDHKVVREGLAALLASEQDLDVVGHAANGREAIDMAAELRPDVVVMDVAMPVMDGDEAARHIKQQLPQIRIVGLSMFHEAVAAERMLKAGADAYLLKTSPAEELLSAIRGIPRRTDGDGPAVVGGPTEDSV
ncbi:MAG: PAS domain-containing protein [Solirubrobacterales bacterium]